MLQFGQITPWLELDLVLRLLLATVMGGLIGYERERSEKPAGFRTMLLVCLGSALFGIMSVYGFRGTGVDTSRVAAAVVIGVGFLGAGTILHEGRIVGLTTAAAIWIVAGIGLSIGIGFYVLGAVTTIITYVVLRMRWEPGRRK